MYIKISYWVAPSKVDQLHSLCNANIFCWFFSILRRPCWITSGFAGTYVRYSSRHCAGIIWYCSLLNRCISQATASGIAKICKKIAQKIVNRRQSNRLFRRRMYVRWLYMIPSRSSSTCKKREKNVHSTWILLFGKKTLASKLIVLREEGLFFELQNHLFLHTNAENSKVKHTFLIKVCYDIVCSIQK